MPDSALGSEAFVRLMGEMRPRLHRYCARMVGSAIDGEDVVQEALIKANEAWPVAGPLLRPEAWLFRIAHNAALDALRRRRRTGLHSDAGLARLPDEAATAEARVAAAGSFATFLALPASQRACVVLADVLGHSLEEIGETLDLTIPAVKAALHRGRGRLKVLSQADGPTPSSSADRQRLRAYVDLFNARDFDALRALLADDVRLDLANRLLLTGAGDVSVYFGRYEQNTGWSLALGWAEGRPALVFLDPGEPQNPTYVALVEFDGDRVSVIRDFRYAPYVMEGLAFEVG